MSRIFRELIRSSYKAIVSLQQLYKARYVRLYLLKTRMGTDASLIIESVMHKLARGIKRIAHRRPNKGVAEIVRIIWKH